MVKTVFPLQKARVQSLVGQLRSHRPMEWSKKAKKKKIEESLLRKKKKNLQNFSED